jgi:hypothetical protein
MKFYHSNFTKATLIIKTTKITKVISKCPMVIFLVTKVIFKQNRLTNVNFGLIMQIVATKKVMSSKKGKKVEG